MNLNYVFNLLFDTLKCGKDSKTDPIVNIYLTLYSQFLVNLSNFSVQPKLKHTLVFVWKKSLWWKKIHLQIRMIESKTLFIW